MSVHAENDMPRLRGVLIQSRIVADDTTIAGTFAVNAESDTTTQLSACTPPNVREPPKSISLSCMITGIIQ